MNNNLTEPDKKDAILDVIAERNQLCEELRKEKEDLSIKLVEFIENLDRYSPDFGYYAGHHQKAFMESDSTGDYIKLDDLRAIVEKLIGKPFSEVGR